MAEFTATARIPCRPLSYENKDLAKPKELLIDYSLGNIWLCKEDGSFVDIGTSIKEIIKQDPDISKNITIVIDGDTYDLQTIIAQQATNIEEILKALGYYVDDDGEIHFDLLDKIASYDPETGDITFIIKTTDIVEDGDKLFITQEEKDKIAQATHPEIIRVTILGGSQAWTGSAAPYTQQITVEGIKESDVPVVDISLGDIYDTIQKQLDSYAYIYKILTYDGYIVVYASEPTKDDLTVQMKVDR